MKVAVVTDDGTTIAGHFGRAQAYLVLTVEGDRVTSREVRPKSAPHVTDGGRHGSGPHEGPEADQRHDAMLAPILDCDFLVARGMGRGAHERIASAGIRPVVTDLVDPGAAAIACASGTITDHAEQLH